MRKWGSRNDISWWASGYSLGHSSSFQRVSGGAPSGAAGLNLSQPLPPVPPSVATEPVITAMKNRQRAVCQPPRLPAPAARQLWEANLVGCSPMMRAIRRISAAATPQTCSARSGV